jgi:hypothetical protein
MTTARARPTIWGGRRIVFDRMKAPAVAADFPLSAGVPRKPVILDADRPAS